MRNFRIEDWILYEDKEILVCHKPAGIAVQSAGFGTMDMESALKNYLSGKGAQGIPYVAVLHRLDQPVEGAIVFAKTPRAAGELSRQIANGEADKRYLAVTSQLAGEITKFSPECLEKNESAEVGEKGSNVPVFWHMQEQRLTDYLKKEGRSNTSAVVPKGTQGSKEARLSYQVQQELRDDRTISGKRYLVSIHLDTGRHHQIRVQMAHAGMPLLGDRKYNMQEKTEFPLGLCSCVLAFTHPGNKKKMRFEIIPKGEAFQGFLMNN